MEWPNHKSTWREWRDAAHSARMHHGWIFSGKAGLGKHDFALAAARELVAEAGIPQPAGVHPDIIVLNKPAKDDKEEKKRLEGQPYETKRNISVAQIRSMQSRLNTRPTLGARRVVIVDPADDMERSASNALLKSLEEPPQGTFFFLVTHRASGLLPTIRSRCRMLRFAPLCEATIAAHLAEKFADVSDSEREAAVRLCGGSLGHARKFLSLGLGPAASIMHQLITHGDQDLTLRSKLAAAIGPRPDREKLHLLIDLARSSLGIAVPDAETAQRAQMIETHEELVLLGAQVGTYNFDTGLLINEIAGLLARAGNVSEPAYG